MRAVFVAGTDTGVGKTVITGLLAGYLAGKGYRVVTQKWVQTGAADFSQDIDGHLKLMMKRRSDFEGHMPQMAPYIFKFASSPHLAARLEKKRIRISKIKRSFADLSGHFDFIVVEGAGGLMVPLNKKRLMIDLVKEMRLPVVLVAENGLGAINNTLLGVEALKARGMRIVGTIFNNISKGERGPVLKDNPVIVKRLTGVEMLGIMPRAPKIKLLYKSFAPIGKRILDRL